jgi:alanyl-tRNA synthetase
VLQGKHDNYDIDLLRALIVGQCRGHRAPTRTGRTRSHRVIADHLRSTSFLIADGVLPSNEGRGYVLRRIMRRAMRHAHMMGARDPLMAGWCRCWCAKWARPIPSWPRRGADHRDAAAGGARFQATLDRGLKLLEDEPAGWARAAPCPATSRSSSTTPMASRST